MKPEEVLIESTGVIGQRIKKVSWWPYVCYTDHIDVHHALLLSMFYI